VGDDKHRDPRPVEELVRERTEDRADDRQLAGRADDNDPCGVLLGGLDEGIDWTQPDDERLDPDTRVGQASLGSRGIDGTLAELLFAGLPIGS
jgi:hypothetical protein